MSQHHQKNWKRPEQQLWRQRIEATLPRPCVDCGRPVTKDQHWQVGHIIPISQGGRAVAQNLGPSHTGKGANACNQRAGGRLGAEVTNKKRKASDTDNEGAIKW